MGSLLPQRRLLGNTFRDHSIFIERQDLRGEIRRSDTSRQILGLIESDRRLIEQLGRPASSVLRVHQHLQRKPIITIPATAQQLSLSAPTVAKALHHMAKLAMVRETTGKQRHRLFTYHRYLGILNEGTELSKVSQ